jgi:hypothetical protein
VALERRGEREAGDAAADDQDASDLAHRTETLTPVRAGRYREIP